MGVNSMRLLIKEIRCRIMRIVLSYLNKEKNELNKMTETITYKNSICYEDSIYGKFNIVEPIILKLINSLVLQRLKGIDQVGFNPHLVRRNIVSRFSHSVGVYLLLKKYKASIEAQIAGLIHDASHSCFSHCGDYALKNGSEKNQSLQDDIFDGFVKNSEIKNIIEEHGFDIDYILSHGNFSLLEKDLPALCADRIDYSIRDAFSFWEINEQDKNYILGNLIVENKNWIFKNLESATMYANMFSKMNTKYYTGLSSAIMFRVVGDFLKHSLEKNYITEENLYYATDSFVIQKIKKFVEKDKRLNLLWRRVNNKTKIIDDPDNYDVQIFCKSRIVDPLFKDQNGETRKMSDINQKWKEKVKQECQPKQYFLKFLG